MAHEGGWGHLEVGEGVGRDFVVVVELAWPHRWAFTPGGNHQGPTTTTGGDGGSGENQHVTHVTFEPRLSDLGIS